MNNFYEYGLQRSGTNYLWDLIKKNFPEIPTVHPERFSHKSDKVPYTGYFKHNFMHPDSEGQNCFYITKNPFQWIKSFHHPSVLRKFTNFKDINKFAMNRLDFQPIYKGHIVIKLQERVTLDSPIEYWLTRNQNFYDNEMFHFKYENILIDYEKELRRFADYFGLNRDRKYQNIESEAGPKHFAKQENFTKKRERYLQDHHGLLNDEAFQFVLSILKQPKNAELLRELGYDECLS